MNGTRTSRITYAGSDEIYSLSSFTLFKQTLLLIKENFHPRTVLENVILL